MKKRLIFILVFALSLILCLFVACSPQKDKVETYTVSFYLTEDSLYKEVKVNEGEKVSKPLDPNMDGMKFIGWMSEKALEVEFNFDLEINEDVDLYAKWEKVEEKYTITLKDETIYKEFIVEEGQSLEELVNCNLEKDGYIFLGWYLNDEKIEESYIPQESIELTAKWEKVKEKYTITLKDETIYKEFIVEEGQSLEELVNCNLEKDGYIFLGWYLNDEKIEESYIPQENIELTAKWEIYFEEEFIDLEFYVDGEYYKSMSFEPGEVVTLLDRYKAEKYGYEFIGWYIGEERIYNGYMPKKSAIVEARFEPLGTLYVVSVDGEEREFLEGDIYSLPTKFKNGMTLIGYADEEKNVYNGDIEVFSNLVLTSVWKTNGTAGYNFDIVFEEKETVSVMYGDLVVLPAVYKYGYEFLGWTDGVYKYKKGFNFTVVNKETFTPLYKQYDMGDDYSSVAYTICNLDMFYESLPFPLRTNIELPTYDEFTKANITWVSNNISVLTSDGVITRTYHKDRNIEVVMTAVITCGEVSETVDYTYTVKQSYKSLNDGIAAGYLYPSNGISELGLNTLDIIYAAFLYFDNQGNISDGKSYVNSVNTFLSDAHAKGVRVIASIGAQGTNTIKYIKTISESAALIERFADNLLKYVIENKLDGIDMDWETPGSTHATYYTKLMKVIYEKFKEYDEELLVTSAIGAGPWQYKYYDLKNSGKYHDYINMMSYDMQSSGISTYQNALYSSSNNYLLTSECCIDSTVKLYNSVGIPNEKIIIGIPFYGREYANSTGPGTSSNTNGAINQSLIASYISEYGSSIEFWDDECKVPYIYIAAKGIFVTYDNPRSIAEKMKYVGVNGLAGIMYWQNGQDYNSLLITAINENYQYLK